MKINFVSACTLYEASKETLKEIDYRDLSKQNLVVVPDSFSMQTESLIFNVLGIKSTFNIAVVGISRLASKILRENNFAYERVSGLEELLLTYKAVKTNENKFSYFKNYGVDFCVNILQIIKQIKNCSINLDDFSGNADPVLTAKINDIKLIANEYDKLLGSRLDLSKLLTFFINKDINLANVNLYFVNFDSFSTEIFNFICALSAKVNKITVAIAKPDYVGNAYIFETDTTEKMFKLATSHGIMIGVKEKNVALDKNTETVVKNLFSVKIEENKSDFYTKTVAKSVYEEAELVAKLIRYNCITSGEKYKNFAVALANDADFQVVKDIFVKYDIPTYLDHSSSLMDIAFSQFFVKILQLSSGDLDGNALLYLLSSPFVGVSGAQEKVERIIYEDIQSLADFNDNTLDEIVKIMCDIKNSKNIEKLCENSQKIVDFALKNMENFNFAIKNDAVKVDENRQAVELISNILSEITKCELDEKMELKDFIFLIKTLFAGVSVETVPAYVDAVFVGNATKSYFEDVSYLFVLGGSALPITEKDTGIITDADIATLKETFVIEPEIRTINRRNRLKLFEALQHAKKHLYVFTEADGGKTKSCFADDLAIAFGVQSVSASNFSNFDRAELTNENLEKLLCFNLGAKSVASDNFKKLENALPARLVGTARQVCGSLPFSYNYEKIEKNTEKIPKNCGKTAKDDKNMQKCEKEEKFSASRLETYFACPFKHFAKYTLSLQERKFAKEDKAKLGTVKHALAQKFVENLGENVASAKDSDIQKFLDREFLPVCQETLDVSTLSNAIFMRNLRKECFVMLSNIAYEQSVSAFKIVATEKFVESKISGKKFVGLIDRVDENGEYFRIIDYKTGETEGVLKELYYGKKLQLFLYGNVIMKQTKKKCAGVYYFNCKSKPTKKNENVKLLSGLTLKDNEVCAMTDKNLPNGAKSALLSAMLKAKVKDGEFAYKYGAFTLDFERYFNYAKKICERAICEIDNGFIMPKPLAGECVYCKYKSICKFNFDEQRNMTTNGDF